MTSPRFDFTSPSMPAHVRYTGPVLDDPAWCESWRSPWSDDDARPLVLVGLSSTFQDQADALRRIVDALANLPVRALVTRGPTIPEGDVTGRPNVIVVGSAPHAEVLRHTAVLVTHCGHGTTMRGLAAGVPLVCMPMGRDQNDTAVRVVHHGAGVRISPKASSDQIRAAVERVLSDPTFREKALAMRRALETSDGCVDIIESLENLARRAEPRSGVSDHFVPATV
jgi:MGT family glycosyltransferase